MKGLLVGFLAVSATASLAASKTDVSPDALRAACVAVPGSPSELDGITVADEPESIDGLSVLRATHDANGAFLRIFYEPGTQALARARAACLGAQIALVWATVGDERNAAEWWSVVFTQDPAYRAVPAPGQMPRWAVVVQEDGTVSPRSAAMVGHVMPHEQVHAYQGRGEAHMPRWLAEGHAQWVQNKLIDRFDPAVARRQQELRAARAAESEGPLKLIDWGRRKPKREAYLRQVSAEERARMEADPTYRPTGVFTFTSDDFEGEFAANDEARYAASARIVEGLEARHGTAAVNRWIAELTGGEPGRVSDEAVDASLRSHFGETLDEVLGDAR